jgi:hypothetical protein
MIAALTEWLEEKGIIKSEEWDKRTQKKLHSPK